MNVVFNGLPRTVADHMTVAQLLNELALESKYVAVEVNYQLVPRKQHSDTELHDGDLLEIVTLVGGG